MDETVSRAMAKWPNVPAVYGWLSLDRRGRWLIRGGLIGNKAAVEFINRNYAVDEAGRWFFQNGPQRVFVDLDYTPWVLRLRGDGGLETHTREPVQVPERVYMDEHGNLLIAFESGIGLVEDRDLEALSEQVGDSGGQSLEPDQAVASLAALAGAAMTLHLGGALLPIEALEHDAVAGRFGFDPAPREPGPVP